MNRHHPYGGYDERPARGGRGGGPSSRGRPPRPGGMSPPPSGYPSAQAAYNPSGSDAGGAAYPPQNAYNAASEFAGGPDRHYPMPMSGGGPPRGGMAARGAHGSRPPPPPGHGPNMSPTPAYGYTPASYENAPYNASNPYESSSTAPNPYASNPVSASARPPPGPPPYGQPPPGFPQDYNSGGPPPSGPPPSGYEAAGQDYGRPPPFGQPYQSGPSQEHFGRPRPPRDGPGFRGGRGGGRGGRGGGRGGFGGSRDEDEKPCRTLFVRSINFETDSQFVQQQFENFGEIKTFFDMVNKRGIAFITYYDLRSARDAMLAMKGSLFGGRPINIHYSLPREEDKAQRCDRDKNQGTLFTVLKGATETLSEDAVQQVFAEFGDVKKIRDYPGQKNSRFVEYFDSRACQLAHDRLNGQSHLDGQWDLKFAWDVVTDDDKEWAQQPQNGGGPDFQAGPPGQQPGWGRPGPPQSDRAPVDYSGFDASGSSGGPPPSLGYGRAPIPPTGAPVDNGWGRRAGSGSGPSAALSPTPAPATVPGQAPGPADASRLEQAQKVQQLLASLGAAGKPPAPAAPATPPPAAASPPARSPPPTSTPSAAPALPANIAALLQSAAGAPKPMQPSQPQSPNAGDASASGQDNGQQSMHQLLSMLNQNRPPRPS